MLSYRIQDERETHFIDDPTNKNSETLERNLFKSSKESGDVLIDDNISEFSDESLSPVNVLTDLKILEESFNSKINNIHMEVTKSQNRMFKDLETIYQNKIKQLSKEFENKLIDQRNHFNLEIENLKREIKKLNNESTDFKNQLRNAQKDINSIKLTDQLKPVPTRSSNYPQRSQLPNTKFVSKPTDVRKLSHDEITEPTNSFRPNSQNSFQPRAEK